jgi:hypothetical protein
LSIFYLIRKQKNFGSNIRLQIASGGIFAGQKSFPASNLISNFNFFKKFLPHFGHFWRLFFFLKMPKNHHITTKMLKKHIFFDFCEFQTHTSELFSTISKLSIFPLKLAI